MIERVVGFDGRETSYSVIVLQYKHGLETYLRTRYAHLADKSRLICLDWSD